VNLRIITRLNLPHFIIRTKTSTYSKCRN